MTIRSRKRKRQYLHLLQKSLYICGTVSSATTVGSIYPVVGGLSMSFNCLPVLDRSQVDETVSQSVMPWRKCNPRHMSCTASPACYSVRERERLQIEGETGRLEGTSNYTTNFIAPSMTTEECISSLRIVSISTKCSPSAESV